MATRIRTGGRTASALLLLIAAAGAHAFPFSVSQRQDITQVSQDFTFNFASLPPSDGTGGTFSYSANGDFDSVPGENATITLDLGIGGTLVLNASGIFSNTIAGLSLQSFSSTEIVEGFDYTIDAVFDLSAALLNAILANGAIQTSVDLGDDVQFYGTGTGTPCACDDENFVEIAFDYNVPEPATFVLLGLGLAGLGSRMKRGA